MPSGPGGQAATTVSLKLSVGLLQIHMGQQSLRCCTSLSLFTLAVGTEVWMHCYTSHSMFMGMKTDNHNLSGGIKYISFKTGFLAAKVLGKCLYACIHIFPPTMYLHVRVLARLTQQLVELWLMTFPPLLGPFLALVTDFFLSLLRPLGKSQLKPSNCVMIQTFGYRLR